MKKIRDVRRSKTSDGFEADQSDFVLDPFIHRQPVKRAEQRGDVSRFFNSENKSCSIILNSLKFKKEILRAA